MQNYTLLTCAFTFIPILLIFFVGRCLLEQLRDRLGNTLRSGVYTADSRSSTHINSVDPLLPTVSKESDFPASWWTGDEVFELEKRAIFSRVSINQESYNPRYLSLLSLTVSRRGFTWPIEPALANLVTIIPSSLQGSHSS